MGRVIGPPRARLHTTEERETLAIYVFETGLYRPMCLYARLMYALVIICACRHCTVLMLETVIFIDSIPVVRAYGRDVIMCRNVSFVYT